MPKQKCVEPNCTTRARGKTDKCIAHGGGPRCTEANCESENLRFSEPLPCRGIYPARERFGEP